MISESPYATSTLISKSIAFFRPWINASYSTVLFVQLNSSLHAIHVLFPFGSINKQPAPAPSLYFDPSKYKVQVELFATTLLSIIFTLFTISVNEESWEIVVTLRISDCCLLSEK